MDLRIIYIPYGATEWTVTKAVAAVLHSDGFMPREPDERVVNFRVKLNPSIVGGVRNDGSGVLSLPSEKIGERFYRWVRQNPIRIEKRKIVFYKIGKPPLWLSMTLERTPYVNPDIEEEHQNILYSLEEALRIDAVQFGVFYRHEYPAHDKELLKPRAFSIEWESDLVEKSLGWLRFEYDHKLIRAGLGNPMTDKIGSSIAISFASINKIGVGYDGKPYLCFDTLTPPVLEDIEFHRALTGNDQDDDRKYKHRAGSLHPGHEKVAPYAQQLRIILYNDLNVDMIDKFKSLCKFAGLECERLIIDCSGPRQIEAHRRGFFTSKRLYQLRTWFSQLDWPVAFQLEALLHNAHLHTEDLMGSLYKPINELCQKHANDGGEFVGEFLRRFSEALQARPPRESPVSCFYRVLKTWTFLRPKLSPGNFVCCHITFAPTRLILEGPYATQSNRVIRRYHGYEDNFIRVDFRDEDRLQYRWDREVDGISFLRERVGSTLKNGFELAGRDFEFLAYSTSALREHSVWFMHPFEHPEEGWVTSEQIRSSLGDFAGTELLKCPSKYAARMAQAFTATDPSVRIHRDQWEEVPDLGSKPYLFTDGVGTISKALGDKIWAALCEGRRDHGENAIQPSAYQIRFLGYKGVVGVDDNLDGNSDGIQMRLRPSMRKFENKNVLEADIEIARAFDYPNTSYLNRPFVMILEDRGIRREAFIDLQDIAVAEARMVHDSIAQFRKVLNGHGLGKEYRLSSLMQRIEGLGLDLNDDKRIQGIDNPFLRQLRQVAMTDVLRDIKHSARIPVPNSHLLVGVADEGPAYKNAGHENVFILPKGKIYACVQQPGDPEPTWIKGSCIISRSPVVHPGDIQRVTAIGKPPEGMLCSFANMKNVVVLSSQGERSLASCLGGGDLDGDLYDVIQYPALLPPTHEDAASYPPCDTLTLEHDSTVDDICDFIVEYINSDVLGLLSDRLLVIADQSKDGIYDNDCRRLAGLCSQAVDFSKHGIPIDLDKNVLPRTLIRCKPDWHAAEVVSPRKTDYYDSDRALGHLYRSITLDDPQPEAALELKIAPQSLTDPISVALTVLVRRHVVSYVEPDGTAPGLRKLFRKYVDELRYICATHTVSNEPGVRLLEAEVVVGSILAKCSQKRWRKDRIYRMRLHASVLVREIQRGLLEMPEQASVEELQCGLDRAWGAWDFSLRHRNEFGANSFGLIALGIVFNCLEKLGARPTMQISTQQENVHVDTDMDL